MTKFQALTREEKIEHIWEYYRFHIIGTILGLFAISSLLISIFGPKDPPPAINVVIMGMYAHDDEKIEHFKTELQHMIDSEVVDSEENGEVSLNMFVVDWEDASPMTMALSQKLVLMFQAKEIDIMIVDNGKFESFMVNMNDTLYEPLDEKADLAEILEKNKDELIKRSGDDAGSVYGLSAKNSKKLHEIGIGDDYVVSLPSISENKENALKTIKWLYE